MRVVHYKCNTCGRDMPEAKHFSKRTVKHYCSLYCMQFAATWDALVAEFMKGESE